jgi:Ca-activated chloride channel homolog
MRRVAWFGVSLIATAAWLCPGTLPKGQDYTISADVNVVLLDASVKDRHGEYVAGLPQAAFEVREDGKPRRITAFANADAPVTLGLVVDNSSSMRYKRPEVIQAGLAFAKASNRKDEFFVVNFNDRVVPGLSASTGFTDDLNLLRSALYFGKPAGRTALYDAIAYSLKHLDMGHHDKRTLIVVSDGGDTASAVSFQELTGLIQSSRVTIYTVGLSDVDDLTVNLGVLRKVASMSGGQYFQPQKLEEVTSVFEKISRDIRSRYMIGYVPDETNNHRRLRSVTITARADGHKLAVKSRTAYMIPSPGRPVAAQESR